VSQVVLLILAVVWAVFLVPQVLRARAARTGDSVGAFAQQLSILGRTSPAGSPHLMRPLPMVPGQDDDDLGPSRLTLEEARRRRRDVIRVLLVAMGATLLLGLVFRKLLMVHLLLDMAFVAYLVLLYRAQAMSADRRARVRRLRAPGPVAPRHHGDQDEPDEPDELDEPGDDTGRVLERAGH